MRNIIILMLLVNCAPNYNTDPDLQSYVDEYQSDVYNRGLDYVAKPSIFVASTKACGDSPTVIGCCISYDGSTHHVRIVKSAWNMLDHLDRLSLMYHEQGHCAQGLNHTKTGIMRSYIYQPYNWDDWEYTKDEFFKETN